MKDDVKNILIWVLLALALFTTLGGFGQRTLLGVKNFSYTEFLSSVQQDRVDSVVIEGQNIRGMTKNSERFSSYMPLPDPYLLPELFKRKVNVVGKPIEQQSIWMRLLISAFPMILLLGIWMFFMRQMQGGGRNALNFGRSRMVKAQDEDKNTRFSDVEGVDEAKAEVSEIVDFLKDPERYIQLGATIPKGVLLVGHPGTGKTLLAKAIAGEAHVPFFSISGSDFVEMFVGVGAARVRDMFEQAKKNAPCILFIDEIDAVGRHRGSGMGGGHDEREQTLNQILVEMDGFRVLGKSSTVIVLAATNRRDVLDKALLRPGRFDREVYLDLPDVVGREKILKVHAKHVPMEAEVDLNAIARGTPGLSGAELKNLINESALIAASLHRKRVTKADLQNARDKILMGLERRSMVMSADEKKLTAYHEAAHAIVGYLLNSTGHDPVYKVSIIPRSRALGVTMFLPEKDRYSASLAYLESQVSTLLAGRIAEGLIFGEQAVTTGASNDIERATELVRNIVMRWGLSKKLGTILYDQDASYGMMNGFRNEKQMFSQETAQMIDQEIKDIMQKNYDRAEHLLQTHMDELHAMAQALIQYETIDEHQVLQIMTHQPVSPTEGSHLSDPSSASFDEPDHSDS